MKYIRIMFASVLLGLLTSAAAVLSTQAAPPAAGPDIRTVAIGR